MLVQRLRTELGQRAKKLEPDDMQPPLGRQKLKASRSSSREKRRSGPLSTPLDKDPVPTMLRRRRKHGKLLLTDIIDIVHRVLVGKE